MKTAIQLGSRWETLIPAYDDVPALEVQVGALTREALSAAQSAYLKILDGVEPEEASPENNAAAREAYSRELAVFVIESWRGVGDSEGKPIDRAPSADEVCALMRDHLCLQAFDEKVVAPYLRRVAEKNGYSLSAAAGTASKGATTAQTVQKPTRNPSAENTAKTDASSPNAPSG